MSRGLLLFLLCASTGMAQILLEGEAVNKATGAPLPGVRVATLCDPTLWTSTDATGHFQFTGTAACGVMLDGPGLLPGRRLLELNPQDSHISLRVAMTPQAAIAGKVVDENGWPVRATVTLAQFVTNHGARELEPVRRAQTNDLGAYRIAKLTPGRYYVRVRPTDEYLPVWYPSAADAADARAIDLQEGQELTGADIALTPGGGVEVRGRVNLPEAHLYVAWEELGSTTVPGTAVPIAADGSFILHHVAPGKYRLRATTSALTDDSTAPANLAIQTLQVSTRDIEGVSLQIVPTPKRDLRGTVVCEGGIKPEQVHIALQRALSNTRLLAEMQPDGSFVIRGVWPGSYRGTVTSDRAEAVSFLFGSEELSDREIDFDGADRPLRVTVRDRSALLPIAGTVSDAQGRPVAGASVVMMAAGENYVPEPFGRRPLAETNQNGGFSAWPLAPGVYRVYVVADPAEVGQAMENPAFLKAQEQAFPPVRVAAGDQTPLKLVLPAQ